MLLMISIIQYIKSNKQNISRVECGFAAIADVRTHRLDDRMDSYFIAETLKYLFLTFDGSLEMEKQSSLLCPKPPPGRLIFNTTQLIEERTCLPAVRTLWTTEGHIVILDRDPIYLPQNSSGPSPGLGIGDNVTVSDQECKLGFP